MNRPTVPQIEAANCIKKLRSGDAISDEELTSGISELSKLIPFLDQLGERFALVRLSIQGSLIQLEDFKRSREQSK